MRTPMKKPTYVTLADAEWTALTPKQQESTAWNFRAQFAPQHARMSLPEYVQELARPSNDLEKRVEKQEKRDAPIRRLRDDR
jgi:hypothetical protein